MAVPVAQMPVRREARRPPAYWRVLRALALMGALASMLEELVTALEPVREAALAQQSVPA
jgi:hypothetical protein